MRRLVASALAIAALFVFAAPALASKEVIDSFGVKLAETSGSSSGDRGGEFWNNNGIAVNASGVGPANPGDVYVADTNNGRVQRFDFEGNFISAWGANVGSEAVNEAQTLVVEATSGAYTLSYEGATTAPLAYNANAAAVQSALQGLSSVNRIASSGNVSVSGVGSTAKPFAIGFVRGLADTNVAQIVADDSALAGSATVATATQGSGEYEICTVAAECHGANPGTANSESYRGGGSANVADNAKNGALTHPEWIAVDEDSGDVYVSDGDGLRINEYSGTGAFIRSFGWGVDASMPGDGYEVCPAADRCQAGVAGSGAGQVGSSNSFREDGIAVSPPDGNPATGTVFLADTGNRRVDIYALDGTSPSSIGSSATFESGQPLQIAVDSRGILYASNSKADGEVERYDTEDVDGEGVDFLEPISAARYETQTVHFSGFGGGDSFTLGCPGGEVSEPIEWSEAFENPTAKDTLGALEAKCGAYTFVVERSGTDITVTYTGALGEGDLARMTCETVSGAGTCEVTKEVDGHSGTLLPGETLGLAVDPDSDGAGPDADALYALRVPLTRRALVEQLGPADAPGLASPPTVREDVHGAGPNGLGGADGLGLNDGSGRLYVSSSGLSDGDGSSVYILDEVPAAEATLGPVSEVSSDSATLSGSVDPNGALTAYRFEYVDAAAFSASGFESAAQVPLSDAGLGNGTDPVAVENELPDHLLPGTTYHVRLVATRVFTGARVVTGEGTFTTAFAPPGLSATATGIASEEATLRGAIDPQYQAVTSYRFEWGTDTSYGHISPASSLPAGSEPVAVSTGLTGLSPSITYHYRLRATNATGTTTGPDQTFTTTNGQPPQFPKRGYEAVSPLPTEGVPVVPTYAEPSPNQDGTRVVYYTTQALPGSTAPVPDDELAQGEYWQYEALRGADGWKTVQTGIITHNPYALGASAAAGREVTTTSSGVDPDDQNGREDVYLRESDGSFVWLSRDPRIPVGTPQTTRGDALLPYTPGRACDCYGEGFAMSADGSTVVFESERPLLAAADALRPGGQSLFNGLYKWQEGQLSLVSVRPDGSATGGVLGYGIEGGGGSAQRTVSPDGSRVVFAAKRPNAGGTTLYIQTDGEPSVDAMKEAGVPPIPGYRLWAPTFRGASLDDSRIFYTDAARLTPDSGGEDRAFSVGETDHGEDLYAYDIGANAVRDLTPRLDGIQDPRAPESDPAASDRGDALGVQGVSDDGKRIYFVARGAYEVAPSPQGQLPTAGQPNLYLAELDGFEDPIKLRFVATLGEGDLSVWDGMWIRRSAQASPDGSLLAFGSKEDLVGGHPTGGTEQMYVYDARQGALRCASCPADGSLPAGDVEETLALGTGSEESISGEHWQFKRGEKHWVSDDGAVFFDTPTALLPDDRNSAGDVYEYRDGQLALISGGIGNNLSKFDTVSLDGASVFFTTSEALAPQDEEPGTSKLYVARVGGGFPYSPPTPSCDLAAGACEGRGTGAPPRVGAGTAAFEGPGDPKPGASGRCPKGKREVRRKGRVRCVKRHGKRRHHRDRGRTAKYGRRAIR